MVDDERQEETILRAWSVNAEAWTKAVRSGRIDSRARATDEAVISAVLDHRSRGSVLDVGCGEGWLARALAARGMDVTGVDAIPALIERARAAGGGAFRVLSYEALGNGEFSDKFDVVVCNFSLLGQRSAEAVVSAAPALLNPNGVFIVQTLHPCSVGDELPYRDGWRQGSWAGCGPGFAEPAPWYFRTLGAWVALFSSHGLRLLELREPPDVHAGRPASLILVGGAF